MADEFDQFSYVRFIVDGGRHNRPQIVFFIGFIYYFAAFDVDRKAVGISVFTKCAVKSFGLAAVFNVKVEMLHRFAERTILVVFS